MGQSAGLVTLSWVETGKNTEYKIGDTTLDGSMVLSILEDVVMFKTKLGGNNPTEARIQTGESKFTVDLIDSNELREALSTSVAKKDSTYFGGMNNGKLAKTGKLTIHPTYAGSDKTEDIVLFKVIAKITDERTYSADGKKLIKVEFTLMADKVDAVDASTAPTVTSIETGGTLASNTYNYKLQFANDWSEGGLSEQSLDCVISTETGKNTITIPTLPIGINKVIVWRSVDDWATASYFEVSNTDIEDLSFVDDGSVVFTTKAVPTASKAWFYATYKIGA